MQDPMAMANAMMAMQRQAANWVATTKQALAASGHVFDADLQATIAAQAEANPFPPGYDAAGPASPADVAAAQDLARRAMEVVYPPDGLAADDPRLAPVEGITLAVLAIGAKAIGWSTDDAFIDRVVAALGFDREVWDRAAEELRSRTTSDVVVGAFYGQLFSQA